MFWPTVTSVRSDSAESVEFSVSDAAEKSVPFVRGESENRSFGVPAVANADPALGQAGYLDAVSVGETQRALNPVRTRPLGRTSVRSSSHVTTSLMSVGEIVPIYTTTERSLDPTHRSR
jgi:hypothetical protein